MNIIFSASGVLTLLYVALLLSKKNKTLADYILAGWFLLILTAIIASYLNYNEMGFYLGFNEFIDSSIFLHGAFIWFYTVSLTKEDFCFRFQDLLHLLPFLISLGFLLYYPLVEGQEISVQTYYVHLVIKMSWTLFYEIAVLTLLIQHEKKFNQFFSYTEKIELNWLKILNWGFLIIWIIGAISMFLFIVAKVNIPQYGGLFTNLALSIFVLLLGFFGIRHTTIFIPVDLLKKISHPDQNNSIVQSTIDEQADSANTNPSKLEHKKLNQLHTYMQTQKPYLDGELTLSKLAQQLNLAPHHLSSVINKQAGNNFFDFVNRYRVEEVKTQIAQQAHHQQTLLAIALNSGFNSKSSFNRVFKKICGQTNSRLISRR